jgi:hypothetical protein
LKSSPHIWAGCSGGRSRARTARRGAIFGHGRLPRIIPRREFKAIITRHDPRRLLFGSDYPLIDPKLEIKALDKRLKGTGLSLTTIMENGGDLIQSLDSRVDKS